MIKIDKEFSIGADGDNSYLLIKGEPKITVDKKGITRVNSNIIGYFTNLSSLFNRYLDIQVRRKIDNNTITTLQGLKSEIESLKETVKQLLKTEL